MELSWFWRIFLTLSILWNLSGGGRMLLNQEIFLGEFAAAGPPSLFVSLCGLLLLVLAGVTVLILIDAGRYWPLAWFAAAGRTVAGAIMLYYWSEGWVPERILIPGVVDLTFGLGFWIFAILHVRRAPVGAQA